MITSGKRLVVFATPLTTSTSYPYLMSEFDFVWENSYDVTSPSNFTCEPNRPSSLAGSISTALSSNRLPLMNHFLYSNDLALLDIEYPNASYVSTTNAPSGGTGNLGSAASTCKAAYGGRQPTFILVDFFNKGPALDTVDSLNNVTNAVGRTSLSSSSTGPRSIMSLRGWLTWRARPSPALARVWGTGSGLGGIGIVSWVEGSPFKPRGSTFLLSPFR